MKNRKFVALLLCLALMMTVFAACSKAEEAASNAASAVQETAESAAETVQQTAEAAAETVEEAVEEAAETVEEAVSEAASEPAPAAAQPGEVFEPELTAAEDSTITYPLTSGATYEILREIMPNVEGFIMGWEDHVALPLVEEKTGIHTTWRSPSTTVQSEQFQLMIASGDYPDIFDCSSYNGGLQQAAEDDVINDLTDLLADNAPDYWNLLSQQDEDSFKATLKEGRMYAVHSISTDNYLMSGPTARGDWLDASGVGEITTVDDLVDYARYCVDNFGVTNAINSSSDCSIDGVTGAYGLTDIVGTGAYRDGDTVKTCSVSDELRDYLVFFNGLFNDGLISGDFFSRSSPMPDVASTAYLMVPADQWPTMIMQANTEGAYFTAVPYLVLEEGGVNRFGDTWLATQFNGGATMSVSTLCEDVEDCLQFLNWFFTQDGYMAANYGVEGISFNYDADGEPKYTDAVYDNASKMINCFSLLPCLTYQASFDYTYSDEQRNAIQTWIDSDNYEGRLPTLSYTEAENSEYTNLTTDISTYAEEQILKFAIGQTPINDETWAEYCNTMESLGLSRVIELDQAAFTRYLAE